MAKPKALPRRREVRRRVRVDRGSIVVMAVSSMDGTGSEYRLRSECCLSPLPPLAAPVHPGRQRAPARSPPIGIACCLESSRIDRGVAVLEWCATVSCRAPRSLCSVYPFQTVARTWRSQETEELEPPAERGKREAPRRLRRLCMRAVAEKLISLPKARDILREPLDRIEAELKGPPVADADHHQ